MKILGNLSRTDFLKEYWQKKPLLIRQAFPGYSSPISPEELAGIACEDGVESRLVVENGQNGPWQLRYGPFTEKDFLSLPETHWSLLVQTIDHHLPEFGQLLDKFDFIPNWRVDDVMLSYAPLHGSVGPHLDNYDVFLLQAQGKRHWHINDETYSESDFIEDIELQILKEFNAEQDWVLEPGDMLYLPPGVAHYGISLGDCLTISIGFRAPSQKELLSAFAVQYDSIAKNSFYADPNLDLQESPGEIKIEHIKTIRELMIASIPNGIEFNSWFGQFITGNHGEQYEYNTEQLDKDDFHILLKQSEGLNRSGEIRLSYIENEDTVQFFYAGNELNLPIKQLPLIRYLTAHHRIDYQTIKEISDEVEAATLLYKLYCKGCFFFDEQN